MKEDLKNKKILVIVESPNKVKTISAILKKAGYTNARVSASIGHVMALKNGGTYYNTGIEPSKEFEMNLQVADDKKDVISNLKNQCAWADIVYIATDGDNEGYVIAQSLIKFLKLPKTKYRRMVTHEITPKAVTYALENPVEQDQNIVDAGLARWCLDKIIGFRLSPISKAKIGAKSMGRCQNIGVKIVADRENEIKNFKPETYFDIYVNFKKNKTEFKAKYVGTDKTPIEHLKSQEEVDKVKAACDSNYIVKSIDKREKQESPKPPFCTATFQQEVSSKLGLKVKDAMSVAQKLFEGVDINGEHRALITYMRTDDTEMAPEFVNNVLKSYIEKTYGKDKYNAPRKGKKTGDEQNGHECLRCIDPTITPNEIATYIQNDLYQKVYKIIWQRTIASCLPNAVISETTYNIYNNDQKFTMISNEIIDEGYRTVYSYKDDEEDTDDTVVKETFKEGEILEIINK